MKIKVKVVPNSSEQSIEKINENEFKIKLKSVPEKNKANKELLKLLSEYFKVSTNKINISKGFFSKNKTIEIQNEQTNLLYL